MKKEECRWVGASFCRYSATGNTFLIFDNREGDLSGLPIQTYEDWSQRYQVDGLLFVENSKSSQADFHMRYLNADGNEVEMCGNGARSILHFYSQELKLPSKAEGQYCFTTQKGIYFGKGEENFPVQMTEVYDWGAIDIEDLLETSFSYYLNTGVPHCLFEVENLPSFDLLNHGARIRYDKRFERGANANFFSIIKEGSVHMRTYERGVEGETESCGTGATALALSLAKLKGWASPITVIVPGGELKISFNEDYSSVFLAGPVSLLERNTLTK